MSATTYLELVLPAVPSSVPKARNQAAAAVASLGSRLADDVRLCVSEAVTNVVRHAYGKSRGDVEVRVKREDGEVSVRVRDTGKGMTKGEREGRAGGFGLKIIEKVADRSQVQSTPNAGVEVEMVFGERRDLPPGKALGPRRAAREHHAART